MVITNHRSTIKTEKLDISSQKGKKKITTEVIDYNIIELYYTV